MCSVCGCVEGEARIDGVVHARQAGGKGHRHDDAPSGHEHRHCGHAHDRSPLHFGTGSAGASAAGMSQSHMIEIEQDILSKNNDYAVENRRWLHDKHILSVNLISSPGAGKTTLLTATIERLAQETALAVIEGDQETSNDVERIRRTGVPAIQINTGRGCHLDAHMVGHAMESLAPVPSSILFIENVGNLVCPAGFDLGEAKKVVILSVTEGDDKPIKYPDAFAAADLMIVSKIDLLPYVDFDVGRCVEYAQRVNPTIATLTLSASSGEGIEEWSRWLMAARDELASERAASAAGPAHL